MERSHEACEGFGDRSHGGGSDRGKLSYGWSYSMISEAIKLEREKRKTKREDALLHLLENPVVVRAILAFVVMCGARMIADSPKAPAWMKVGGVGLAGIGIPLIAADAGVTDKYALAVFGLAAATAAVLPTSVEGLLGGPADEMATWTKPLDQLVNSFPWQ